MSVHFEYVDVDRKKSFPEITRMFPGWTEGEEALAIFSPHDDDAIIGAGYAILAALANKARVYVFIFCTGNAGYSNPDLKDKIMDIRRGETAKAYGKIGIAEENILRFNYSDFSVTQNMGWYLNNGETGSFIEVVSKLRRLKITRVFVPNHYREHIDHYAVNMIGAYDSPQAGDPILIDYGDPYPVKSLHEYSVWSDFSPEDALVNKREDSLRANRMIAVDSKVEETIREGISCYRSQGEIIKGLVAAREERLCRGNKYVEPYIYFDPRPKLDFKKYVDFFDNL